MTNVFYMHQHENSTCFFHSCNSHANIIMLKNKCELFYTYIPKSCVVVNETCSLKLTLILYSYHNLFKSFNDKPR